jgi:5-formyltetrahydrofolate cyclo-ligase
MLDKNTIREEARRHRARIDRREDDPEDAVPHFFEGLDLTGDEVIAGYWPTAREFDPRPILDECLQRGHMCVLPVIQSDSRVLKFVTFEEGQILIKGLHGIMHPQGGDEIEPDIVLVPMLAFDQRGTRLGQGGGYYDATLADLRCRKAITAVGVAYGAQACLFNLPREDHDEPLDMIVTPQGVKRFYGCSQ